MHDAMYYRAKAAQARKLADMTHDGAAREVLEGFAKDYDETAEDLEVGAIDIRHPDLLPQRRK